MNTDKTIYYIFLLIFVYLALSNARAFNTIVTAGASFLTDTITTLQGRGGGGGATGAVFGDYGNLQDVFQV